MGVDARVEKLMICFFPWVVLSYSSGLVFTFVSYEPTCRVLYLMVKAAAASSQYKHSPKDNAAANR